MMYERDKLLNDLRAGVIEVHFTKVDGENRLMRCTLKPTLLPELYRTDPAQQNEERTFHNQNPGVISAWDIQANGWRSFRIDSVYYAQALDAY
jgi:hypothetical protein